MEGQVTYPLSQNEIGQLSPEAVHGPVLVLSTPSLRQAPNKCFLNASQKSTQMLQVQLTSLLRWVKYEYTGIQMK